MKNSVINVNDHLIARLEELGQEDLSPEELENVVKRADASVKVASALTAPRRVTLTLPMPILSRRRNKWEP